MGNIFQTGKCPTDVDAAVVLQRLNFLEKVFHDFFAAKPTTGLTDESASIQNLRYLFPPRRDQGNGHRIGILTVTESQRLVIIRCVDYSLRQAKSGHQLDFIARRAHDNRVWVSLDSNRERLLSQQSFVIRFIDCSVPLNNPMLNGRIQ